MPSLDDLVNEIVTGEIVRARPRAVQGQALGRRTIGVSALGPTGRGPFGPAPVAPEPAPQPGRDELSAVDQMRYAILQSVSTLQLEDITPNPDSIITRARGGTGPTLSERIASASEYDLNYYAAAAQQAYENPEEAQSYFNQATTDAANNSPTTGWQRTGGDALGWVFRQLDRPGSAIQGALTEGLNGAKDEETGGILQGFWEGLKEPETYNYGQVQDNLIAPDLGIPEGILDIPYIGHLLDPNANDAVQEFAGSIVTDPLTYVTGGANRVNPRGLEGAVTDVARAQSDEITEAFVRGSRQEQAGFEALDMGNPYIAERAGTGLDGRPLVDEGGRFRTRTPEDLERMQPPLVLDPSTGRAVRRGGFEAGIDADVWIPGQEVKNLPFNDGVRNRARLMGTQEDEFFRVNEIALNRSLVGERLATTDPGGRVWLRNRMNRLARNPGSTSDYAMQVQANAGHFYLRFGGAEFFGNNNFSRSLYEATMWPRRVLGYKADGTARWLNGALNVKSTLPAETAEILQYHQAEYNGAVRAQIAELEEVAKDLTPDELLQIGDAIDGVRHSMLSGPGTEFDFESIFAQLDRTPSASVLGEGVATTYDNLGQYARWIAEPLNEIHTISLGLKLLSPDDVYDFFPRILKKPNKDFVARDTMHLSLQELRDKGHEFLDPIQSIREGIARRASAISARTAQKEIIEMMGINVFDARFRHRKIRPNDKKEFVPFDEVSDVSKLERPQDLDPASFALLTDPRFAFREIATDYGREFGAAALENGTRVFLYEPIAKVVELLDEISTAARSGTDDAVIRAFVGTMDTALQSWKKFATIYNPGHHVRNFISDYIMNAAAGVKSKMHYVNSSTMLRNKHSAAFLAISGQGAKNVDTIKLAGQRIPANTATRLYERSGAKTTFLSGEVNDSWATMGENRITRFSEAREDFMRQAHFLHAFEDEWLKAGHTGESLTGPNGILTQNAYNSARLAGQRVNRFNFNYNAKTPFERKYLGRLLPFYTWTRKNLPLQIQLLFTAPGFINRYPKYIELVQNLTGVEEDGFGPLVPDWLMESMPVQLAMSKSPVGQVLSLFGVQPGQQAALPLTNLTPFADIGRLDPFFGMAEDVAAGDAPSFLPLFQEIMGDVTPVFRVPAELQTGRSLLNGAERDTGWDYWLGQLPQGRQLSGAFDADGSFQDWLANSGMRYLTGIGIRPITEENQMSTLRQREDELQGALAASGLLDEANRRLVELGLPELDGLRRADPDAIIRLILEGRNNG